MIHSELRSVPLYCRFIPGTSGGIFSLGRPNTDCWEWLGRLCSISWDILGGKDFIRSDTGLLFWFRKLLIRRLHADFPRPIENLLFPTVLTDSSLVCIRECLCMLPLVVKDMLHILHKNGRSPWKKDNGYKYYSSLQTILLSFTIFTIYQCILHLLTIK